MGERLDLQAIFLGFCPNVYFQPPEGLKIDYPCIVYKRDTRKTIFASNKPYRSTKRYLVTVMDRDPDSEIPEQVAALPMSAFDRHYTVDKLHHDVYRIFF